MNDQNEHYGRACKELTMNFQPYSGTIYKICDPV